MADFIPGRHRSRLPLSSNNFCLIHSQHLKVFAVRRYRRWALLALLQNHFQAVYLRFSVFRFFWNHHTRMFQNFILYIPSSTKCILVFCCPLRKELGNYELLGQSYIPFFAVFVCFEKITNFSFFSLRIFLKRAFCVPTIFSSRILAIYGNFCVFSFDFHVIVVVFWQIFSTTQGPEQ